MNNYAIDTQNLSLEDRLNLVRVIEENGGNVHEASSIRNTIPSFNYRYFALTPNNKWSLIDSIVGNYINISYQDFIQKFDKPKFNIDPTKIKPDMIIHTPTLEQAQAICNYINKDKISERRFEDYKTHTCINTNNGKFWTYNTKVCYDEKVRTITSFEDILVQESKDSTIEHKYSPRDKVLVKPDLGGHINTHDGMEELIGKVVTIKEQRGYDYYYIEEMTYAWHAQMFEPYLQFKVGDTVVLKSSITKIPENMQKYKFIKPTLITDIDYELEIATLSNGLDYHFNLLELYTTTTVAPSANPTPTIKELEMNNTTLKLLLTLMGVTTETIKDATNSNYIGIITNEDNSYVGYVYADTVKQLKEIIAKSENEGNTIHCLKFQDSFKQATRPVVKVSRASSEVVEESDVPK